MNIYQVAIGEVRLPVEGGGGADNFIFSFSKHLAKRGHNVTLLDRKHLPTDPPTEYRDGLRIVRLQARRCAPTSVPVFSRLLSFGLNEALFAMAVRRYLSRVDGVDVVHINSSTFVPILTFGSRSSDRKLFYSSHTPRRLLESPQLSDRLALVLENRLLRRVSKVIVLNQLVRERLSEATNISFEDISVLPVGIDPSDFRPDLDRGDIEDKYGLWGRIPILFVGRIREIKGLEYLVRAVDILVHRWGHKEIKLLAVGPTEDFGLKKGVRTRYLKRILTLIRERRLEENVELTGPLPTEDLKRLYVASHVFVLPSLSEATPTVVLEAMACAKPVVASRVGGIPEQVEEGRSGLLVPPGDAEALAEKIGYLLDHPQEARQMGVHGRKLVEEKFTWEHLAGRLEEIYEKVVRA